MPVTYQSKEFKDISLSFKVHPVTKDILVLKNSDAIKRSLMNLVKTNIGDRFYEKNIGTKANSLLFENFDDLNKFSFKRELANVIRNYEPRVLVESTSLDANVGSNSLQIGIRYKIIGQNDIEDIQILVGN